MDEREDGTERQPPLRRRWSSTAELIDHLMRRGFGPGASGRFQEPRTRANHEVIEPETRNP